MKTALLVVYCILISKKNGCVFLVESLLNLEIR
jgi:hypothetical protein